MSIDLSLSRGITDNRMRLLQSQAREMHRILVKSIGGLSDEFPVTRSQIKEGSFNRFTSRLHKQIEHNPNVVHLRTGRLSARRPGFIDIGAISPATFSKSPDPLDRGPTHVNLVPSFACVRTGERQIHAAVWVPPVMLTRHALQRYIQRHAGTDFEPADAARLLYGAIPLGVACIRLAAAGAVSPLDPVIVPVPGGVLIGRFAYDINPNDQFIRIDRHGTTHCLGSRDRVQRFRISLKTFVSDEMLALRQMNAVSLIADTMADGMPEAENHFEFAFGRPRFENNLAEGLDEWLPHLRRLAKAIAAADPGDVFSEDRIPDDSDDDAVAILAMKNQVKTAMDNSSYQLLEKRLTRDLEIALPEPSLSEFISPGLRERLGTKKEDRPLIAMPPVSKH